MFEEFKNISWTYVRNVGYDCIFPTKTDRKFES